MNGWLDELRADFRGGMPWVIWGTMTVIVSFAGPFGTYLALSFPLRLLYWSVIMAFVILLGISVRAFVHGTLGLRTFRYGSTLIAAILSLIIPPIALTFLTLPPFSVNGMIPEQHELALYVFLTSLGVGAYRHAMMRRAKQPETADSSETLPEPTLPRLILRLPPDVQGDLVAISVRDHYVDVTTTKGIGSVLMRLTDAIAEVGDTNGAQVHRSHWVAWEAVEAVEKANGRVMLQLRGGRMVPVSRPYRAIVDARGIGIRSIDDPHSTAMASGPIRPENAGSSAQRPPV